ncbi:2Fe-2S iron-sulfur cluster-binding protein [Vibrio sp. SS-MA-C1-2]|uniref:(2Fe-2S)-binding protein n=1 Tax=Vibrio sp. SS-MA-C1-2 TaxID=2908646 RepID=UPI001F377223|nr:2Fe-2S iron-sulfur cluster-binding protein [Vibrio sp. SS-MA-C1-2]UJF16848.1 2Fe-2S iron-sulfur cluster-binding protein [Vibrio sp. SS-MA-C1-2]
MATISLTINDKLYGPIDVDPQIMMVDFLHEYLNLTGTKFGCGQGVCYACSVIEDKADGTSEIVRTCITNAVAFNGKKLRTIEGHAEVNTNGEVTEVHPVQEAFMKHFSFQCGWCTSGFVNAGVALVEELKRNPIKADDVQGVIEEALGDHVCRCTGYVKYYEAMKEVILATEGTTV